MVALTSYNFWRIQPARTLPRIRSAMSALHPLLPRSRAARQAWLWCLAALLLLQAAVPLLAAAAAAQRGVSLAQVCSVYGVRTADTGATPAMPADHVHPQSPGDTLPDHGAGQHCALASLAGGPRPDALPAVLLHAPPQRLLQGARALPALPADAALRWLSAQLHAPPTRA